jgi:hypothetical protein
VEQRVVKKDEQGESVAFYNKSRKPGGYKGKHKKDGDNDNKTGEGGYRKVTCYKCGKEGHIAKYCRNQGGASTSGSSKEKAIAFAASRSKHQGWVIDSGSDTHLTPEVQMLEGYRKLDTPVKVEGFNG